MHFSSRGCSLKARRDLPKLLQIFLRPRAFNPSEEGELKTRPHLFTNLAYIFSAGLTIQNFGCMGVDGT